MAPAQDREERRAAVRRCMAIAGTAACGSDGRVRYGAGARRVRPPPARSAEAPAPTAATPLDDAGPGAGHAGDGREQRLIARMLKRVERARGVSATGPVPGVVLSRDRLLARVKEHLAAELPPEAIRNEGLALQLFGFVPTTFDYEGAEYDLLQDQLAGYYEPADRTMYMASDLGQTEAEATLAHELVHALQDQKWDLATRCKYHPGEGDRSEAVSALAEGDATSAMFDVLVGAGVGAPRSRRRSTSRTRFSPRRCATRWGRGPARARRGSCDRRWRRRTSTARSSCTRSAGAAAGPR